MGRFVKRDPLGDPGTFCGQVPCPLCFTYGEDNGTTVEVEVFIIREAKGREPIEGECETLREELTAIHEAAKLGGEPGTEPPPTQEQLVEAYDAEQRRAALQRQVSAVLDLGTKERARPSVRVRRRSLDDLSDGEVAALNAEVEATAKQRERDTIREAQRAVASNGSNGLEPPTRYNNMGSRSKSIVDDTYRMDFGGGNIMMVRLFNDERRALQIEAARRTILRWQGADFKNDPYAKREVTAFYERQYNNLMRDAFALPIGGLGSGMPADQYENLKTSKQVEAEAKAAGKRDRDAAYARAKEEYYAKTK